MIRGYGYSAINSNLLTIPVWFSAACSIVFFCILSDKLKKRGPLLITCFSIAAAGWIILLASKSKWVELFGTIVIGCGTLPQVVILQTWMNNNIVGYTKRYVISPMVDFSREIC
jgi:predicted MFS family arabinose efflux permease